MIIYFVDFENIQQIPDSKTLGKTDKLIMFVGVRQSTFKIDLVKNLLLHKRVEIKNITQQGKNNLDFFICFYLGFYHRTAKKNIEFAVISNDKGYDPLIEAINLQGRVCKRLSKEDFESSTIRKTVKKTVVKPKIKKQLAQVSEKQQVAAIIATTNSAPAVEPKTAATDEDYTALIEKIKTLPAKNRPRKVKSFLND